MTNNEIFLRVYKACMENVEQYLKDIERLKEIGSYGHGYALAAIASEELSKALMFYLIHYKLIPYDPRINKKVIRDHTKKLAIQRVMSAFIDIIQSGGEIVSSVATAGKDIQELLTDVETLVNENDFIDLFSKIIEERLKVKKIQEAKEKGLYVDLKGDRLVTPREITLEKLQELLEELEKNKKAVEQSICDVDSAPRSERGAKLSEFKYLLNGIFKEEFLSRMESIIEKALKKMKEKNKRT